MLAQAVTGALDMHDDGVVKESVQQRGRDDWIAEHADAHTVVVTGDILLADRCLKVGATVIGPTGKPFTSASIGGAIATRAIMADLRSGAGVTGGPAPFAKADRSRFLQALDAALVRLGS